MVYLISGSETRKVWDSLTYEEVIETVEDAYRQYGLGLAGGNNLRVGAPPPTRCEMRLNGFDLPHTHPNIDAMYQGLGYLKETNMAFQRIGFRIGGKRLVHYYLFDVSKPELTAIIETPVPKIKGERKSYLNRTGCTGAVGAKYLSKKNSKVVGILGTGVQGKSQIFALSKVRNIEKIFAHSGRRKDIEYAKFMESKLGIDVIACDSAEETVRKAEDILITVTGSLEPYIKGDWINEGVHITAIGADGPNKAEHEASVLKKVNKLVIDDENSLNTKEIRVPLEEGLIGIEKIYGHIGEIVAGVKPARETDSEITFFESNGMILTGVNTYTLVYKKALEMGLGKKLDQKIVDLLYTPIPFKTK